jgi:hypothetical protein
MQYKATIKLQTYSCDVNFIVTDQMKIDSKKIYKKFDIKSEDEEDENEGIVIHSDMTKYFLLIDLKYLSHNTIAHEIYHTVVLVTEDRGVKDEEAQAWLCGHLTGAIYKFLDKKKLQIKHG